MCSECPISRLKTRISGSGDVYLPLIDYVHVADLTTDEAQELIQKRLEDGGFVRGPHVSIFVNESASQAITMVGEVNRPGAYPAIGERRLFDLISAAGGLTDKAGRIVTIEHRGDPDQKVELQLSSNLAEDTQNNVDVFPGDTIIVSRAGIVYVVGDVKPSQRISDRGQRPQRSQSPGAGRRQYPHLCLEQNQDPAARRRTGFRKFPSTSRRYFMPRRRMWPW